MSAHAGEDAAGAMANGHGITTNDALVWELARQGDPDDLARLYHREGITRLLDHAAREGDRPVIIGALRYATDFTPLPWLAEEATTADEIDARSALESVETLVSGIRRPLDPDDADDLHDGCVRLLDLARSSKASQERRISAIRSLRMLIDRGCVKATDIPTDLDAQ